MIRNLIRRAVHTREKDILKKMPLEGGRGCDFELTPEVEFRVSSYR